MFAQIEIPHFLDSSRDLAIPIEGLMGKSKTQTKTVISEHLMESLMDEVKGLYEKEGPFTQSDIIVKEDVLKLVEDEDLENVNLKFEESKPNLLLGSDRSEQRFENSNSSESIFFQQPAKSKSNATKPILSEFDKTVAISDVNNHELIEGLDFPSSQLSDSSQNSKSNNSYNSNQFKNNPMEDFFQKNSEVFQVTQKDHPVLKHNKISPTLSANKKSSSEENYKNNSQYDDRTVPLAQYQNKVEQTNNLYESANSKNQINSKEIDKDKTIAVDGFSRNSNNSSYQIRSKDAIGRTSDGSVYKNGNIYVNPDASLMQAENLRLAQSRISELERENDQLRAENEELYSAGEIIKNKIEESAAKVFHLERDKNELEESFHKEVLMMKASIQFKDGELNKLKAKISDLENRLKSDFKKIRVRERELENRLELSRAEKTALVRAKDESILDLKRKLDHIEGELQSYKEKCLDLNKEIETQNEQFKKTVKTLKLALTNLDVRDIDLFKKVE